MMSASPTDADDAQDQVLEEEESEVEDSWQFVEVHVSPGPLGILLEPQTPDVGGCVIRNFVSTSSDGRERGMIESSGKVRLQSILIGINETDFQAQELDYAAINELLRGTFDQSKTLQFLVPPATPTKKSSFRSLSSTLPSLSSLRDLFSRSRSASSISSSSSGRSRRGHRVQIQVPPGPLGLELDGNVENAAVVTGFRCLHSGLKGLVEKDGRIGPGSVLVSLDGQDLRSSTFAQIRDLLEESQTRSRHLAFLVPSAYRPLSEFTSDEVEETVVDEQLRRKLELQLILAQDRPNLKNRSECWLLVHLPWITAWGKYAAQGEEPPGPVSNGQLLQDDWYVSACPRRGLQAALDYRAVSPLVYCLFVEMHGSDGAPPIGRFRVDMYAEAVPPNRLDELLEEARLEAAELVQTLLSESTVREA